MTTIRDAMRPDTTRSLRPDELAERLRIEREHAAIGECVDVIHITTDGQELARCRAILCDGYTPTPDVPDETDYVAALEGWGLNSRDTNQLGMHVVTVGDLRQALADGRVTHWGNCGEKTERDVEKALRRVDKARRG